MGRVSRNVEEQHTQRPTEYTALRGLAVERAEQVGLVDVGEEAPLLVFELVPFSPELAERSVDSLNCLPISRPAVSSPSAATTSKSRRLAQ